MEPSDQLRQPWMELILRQLQNASTGSLTRSLFFETMHSIINRNRNCREQNGEPARFKADCRNLKLSIHELSKSPLHKFHYVRGFVRTCLYLDSNFSIFPDTLIQDLDSYFARSFDQKGVRVFSTDNQTPEHGYIFPGTIYVRINRFESGEDDWTCSLYEFLKECQSSRLNKEYALQGYFNSEVAKVLVQEWAKISFRGVHAFCSGLNRQPGSITYFRSVSEQACDPLLVETDSRRKSIAEFKKFSGELFNKRREVEDVFFDYIAKRNADASRRLTLYYLECRKANLPIKDFETPDTQLKMSTAVKPFTLVKTSEQDSCSTDI